MNNENLILAVDERGNEIVLSTVKDWIRTKEHKKELSQFVYDRLYGRYIKSFEYPTKRFQKCYKNGFAIMANCCFLIETYVSFKVKEFRNTRNKSERCFGYFFVTEPQFTDFSEGGLEATHYLVSDPGKNKDVGIPHDFYCNVRCGILHSGETKSGWKITRKKNRPLFSKNDKEINATKFMNSMNSLLLDYKKQLDDADFDNDQVWKNCIARLKDILDNANVSKRNP